MEFFLHKLISILGCVRHGHLSFRVRILSVLILSKKTYFNILIHLERFYSDNGFSCSSSENNLISVSTHGLQIVNNQLFIFQMPGKWNPYSDHAVLSGETIVPRTIVLLTVKHHVKGTTAITLLLTIVVSKSYVKDFNVTLMGLQYSLWIFQKLCIL